MKSNYGTNVFFETFVTFGRRFGLFRLSNKSLSRVEDWKNCENANIYFVKSRIQGCSEKSKIK